MSPAARLLVVAGWLGLAAAWLSPASAQQIYRIVGPDGKVTFSDRPPVENAAGSTAAAVSPQASGGGAGSSLPFELRTVANRYPVVLYTQPECGPCDNGRGLLSGRGIPFSEKTVTSREDIEALQRITGGASSLPLLTIGGQQIKGFSSIEWHQFLDVAGYPKTSQLPAGYRAPPVAPMVAAQAPVQPRQAQADGQDAPQRQRAASNQAPGTGELTPPGPTPDNPAGIQF